MKAMRARRASRLKGTLFALALAAVATQVGGAAVAPGMAGESFAAQASVARIPVVAGTAARAWAPPVVEAFRHSGRQQPGAGGGAGERAQPEGLASAVRAPPVPGAWALLVAGLTGVWTIGRRRLSAMGNRSLIASRSRHR
jgi:hypothetical protein